MLKIQTKKNRKGSRRFGTMGKDDYPQVNPPPTPVPRVTWSSKPTQAALDIVKNQAEHDFRVSLSPPTRCLPHHFHATHQNRSLEPDPWEVLCK